VRSLFYVEMTTSPDETCGAEPPRSGRFSRIQFAAALFAFAPASLSLDGDRNRAVSCADEVVGVESVDPADQALDVGFVADKRVVQLGAARLRANGGVHLHRRESRPPIR
jgi:hypothetical protein